MKKDTFQISYPSIHAGTEKSEITFMSIGKIQIIIAAPKTGLNKKLSWKTLTCGAVLEITPRIISCPNVAKRTGDAICSPM